jgi:hypothetical protein
MREAMQAYCDEVRRGVFPAAEHEFSIDDDTWAAIAGEFAMPENQAAD